MTPVIAQLLDGRPEPTVPVINRDTVQVFNAPVPRYLLDQAEEEAIRLRMELRTAEAAFSDAHEKWRSAALQVLGSEQRARDAEAELEELKFAIKCDGGSTTHDELESLKRTVAIQREVIAQRNIEIGQLSAKVGLVKEYAKRGRWVHGHSTRSRPIEMIRRLFGF